MLSKTCCHLHAVTDIIAGILVTIRPFCLMFTTENRIDENMAQFDQVSLNVRTSKVRIRVIYDRENGSLVKRHSSCWFKMLVLQVLFGVGHVFIICQIDCLS